MRTYSKTQRAWKNAQWRCNPKNKKAFDHYAGRGIKFLFTSFEQFLQELGPRPDGMTLERINNNGNYEPGNAKWATVTEQNRNKTNPQWFDAMRLVSEC